MRLIDADECTNVETLKSFCVFEEAGANVADLKELIASCKTVNASLVIHGKWSKLWNDYVCSICGCPASYCIESKTQDRTSFCPNCGARMDL